MEKEVLVIFKTHLDVGFTDYSKNIIKNYIEEFIPNAIKTGYELKNTETPFVWTVGSWMIWKALKEDKTGAVERAVRDGILNWHGLPFTTHTELMNPTMFEAGLDISGELDKKFGRKTIAAKMTDVPGHTMGIVPRMKKRGIEFLHIGVNPATPVPPVPPLFKWKCGEDEITVMYEGDYGKKREFENFVICFAHTGDNRGTQSKEEIIAIYEELKKQYPDYKVRAATLDDVAEKIRTVKDIPVIDKEIGDTWIHGAGTDPKKLAMFKETARYVEENGISDEKLRENLLMIPEHTWGMNVQIFLADDENYTHSQVEAKDFGVIEKSWEEQRNYVRDAQRILGMESAYDTSLPKLNGFKKIREEETPDFEISWQIFDNSDYARYKRDYLRLDPDKELWVKWDYTKPGLPDYRGGIYTAAVSEVYAKDYEIVYKLEFEKGVAEEYGLPYFYVTQKGDATEIKWFGKKPSRLPQACWFKIKGCDENWEIDKLGEWIKPENIIGSPLITAFDTGVRNKDFYIKSYDAALAAPYGRKLLHYNEKDLPQDMYFNLYNNIWDTNFPMWYSDDSVFRFKKEKRK